MEQIKRSSSSAVFRDFYFTLIHTLWASVDQNPHLQLCPCKKWTFLLSSLALKQRWCCPAPHNRTLYRQWFDLFCLIIKLKGKSPFIRCIYLEIESMTNYFRFTFVKYRCWETKSVERLTSFRSRCQAGTSRRRRHKHGRNVSFIDFPSNNVTANGQQLEKKRSTSIEVGSICIDSILFPHLDLSKHAPTD